MPTDLRIWWDQRDWERGLEQQREGNRQAWLKAAETTPLHFPFLGSSLLASVGFPESKAGPEDWARDMDHEQPLASSTLI